MKVQALSEHAGYLFRRAQQAHVAAWLREVSSETTSVQFGVLSALHGSPGSSQRELCEQLDLDRSTIADLVTRLERRGLVERMRSDNDRRRNVLKLTEAGRSVLEELLPRVARVDAALVGGLRREDRVELFRLMNLVLRSSSELADLNR